MSNKDEKELTFGEHCKANETEVPAGKKLRVWWIPQIPCASFYVEVDTVEEGAKLMDTLAKYDAFQFDNNIKPDYSNAGGLQMFSGPDCGYETDEGWEDWDYEDEELGYFDCPDEYIKAKKEAQDELQ